MPFTSLNFTSLAFLGSGRASFLVSVAVLLGVLMITSFIVTRTLRALNRL